MLVQDNFFNYPLENLPRVCIYSLDFQPHHEFYDLDDACVCGNDEWDESLLSTEMSQNKFSLPPQRVNTCSKCGEMRLSKLKRIFEEIIDFSTSFSLSLIEMKKDKKYLMWIIKNVLMRLDMHFSSEHSKEIAFEEVKKRKSKDLSSNEFFLNLKSHQLGMRMHE
jgi:hypothetical protein